MLVRNKDYDYLQIDRKTKERTWVASKNLATTFVSKRQISKLGLQEGSYKVVEQVTCKQALRVARKVIRREKVSWADKVCNLRVSETRIFHTPSMGDYISVYDYSCVDKVLDALVEVSFDKGRAYIVSIFENVENCRKFF